MSNKVYELAKVVGTSSTSVEDAIDNAIGYAAKTRAQLSWFQVLETRGRVQDGKVAEYQVTLELGARRDA